MNKAIQLFEYKYGFPPMPEEDESDVEVLAQMRVFLVGRTGDLPSLCQQWDEFAKRL